MKSQQTQGMIPLDSGGVFRGLMSTIRVAGLVVLVMACVAHAQLSASGEPAVSGKTVLAHGVVVDQTGAVITDAEVVFTAKSGSVVAHADANFAFSANLAPDTYLVTVRADGFLPAKIENFAVPSPGTKDFRVVLKIDPSYAVRADRYSEQPSVATQSSEIPQSIDGGVSQCAPACGQTVKVIGQVVDRSGAPVPNARVLLIDLNSLEIRRTSSDDKGTFEFSGLRLTPYEIKAACPNFVTGSAKILELADRGPVAMLNPPPTLTVNVKITLAVKSSP